jgi:ribonucleoside-diphosphate reductase alpha chain
VQVAQSHSDYMVMGSFAKGIMEQKYAHDLPEDGKEDWAAVAKRVATNVFGGAGRRGSQRGFTARHPDGQGRALHPRAQVHAGRALPLRHRPRLPPDPELPAARCEDSREGWADLSYKAEMALMTGAGIGGVYSKLREEGAPIRRRAARAAARSRR